VASGKGQVGLGAWLRTSRCWALLQKSQLPQLLASSLYDSHQSPDATFCAEVAADHLILVEARNGMSNS
jgi:hypothetical protein